MFQIRPIDARDNAVVATIIRTTMSEFDCVGPGYSIEDPEVDDMHGNYQAAGHAFYVIENAEGDVLGCGGFGPLVGSNSETCELKKMYFCPELRGHGMGRRLLEHAIQQAAKVGYTYMYLETVERMQSANALYQKFGFEPTCTEGATGHSGCDAFYKMKIS